uniref:Uncharacterized protein n=1 Tax=Rousettus aegyptiacus TaxID=9407 RepID=A0A7J8IM34_ROUAE|nr:hypothetical protein HJG63_010772 [Rousettus aegyptiacus]
MKTKIKDALFAAPALQHLGGRIFCGFFLLIPSHVCLIPLCHFNGMPAPICRAARQAGSLAMVIQQSANSHRRLGSAGGVGRHGEITEICPWGLRACAGGQCFLFHVSQGEPDMQVRVPHGACCVPFWSPPHSG